MSPARPQFPPQIVDHALRLHRRFSLGFGDVAARLAERGIQITPATLRRWSEQLPAAAARELARARTSPEGAERLEETEVTLRGERQTLWRAVDAAGITTDILAQRRRDPRAAERFLLRLRADPSVDTFTRRVFTGYQGWFATPNDGVLNRWRHWSRRGRPTPGNVHMDLYPDVRDFRQRDLYPTGLGPFGNGRQALVYSSYRQGILNVHFKWLARYGIAGICLNRFMSTDPRFIAARNTITRMAFRAARRHDRHFYFKFNLHQHYTVLDPAAAIIADYIQSFEREMPDIVPSSRYAKKAGKPVVEIWGAGFLRNNGSITKDQTLKLIDFFKDRGFYVIGGVPYHWREGIRESRPNWQEVFTRFDMITPWSVSKFRTDEQARVQYEGIVREDLDYLAGMNVDYRRVIFPGASFANVKNGYLRNGTPRRAGDFMWRQAYWAARLGLDVFVANFDEFDEGTAIAKCAPDSRLIPRNQWFLTLDADGTHVSSDFYLRLTGEIAQMIAGARPPEFNFSTPYHQVQVA